MFNGNIKRIEKIRARVLKKEAASPQVAQDCYFNARDNLTKAIEWLMRAERLNDVKNH